jgi:hypothetical protein
MPCQSYDSSWANDSNDREVRKIKKEADKLARIACAALTELEENGIAEVLLLKNDELREWWAAHKEADRKEQARLAEKERRARVKEEALARLSEEEKELLGLSRKKVIRKDNDLTKQIEVILRKNSMDEWYTEDGDA